MKKEMKIVLFSVLAVIIVVLGIVFFMVGKGKKSSSEEFQIKMNTNGGVPYVWKYEISNDNVEFVEKKSKNMAPDSAGGPVEEYYIFKAKKAGESTITFKYQSVVNDKIDKEYVYKVVIDKDLKPTLKKIR